MRTFAKILFASLGVAVVAAGLVWILFLSSLPRVDGILEIPVSGRIPTGSTIHPAPAGPYPFFPSDRIKITQDRYGIPTLHAANETDAAFALGFVHARDRLWQMEVMRRLGAGRLSEIFGRRTLAADRFMRTLGLVSLCEDTLEGIPDETLLILNAYTEGVNQYIKSRGGALPPEFLVYFHTPEPWKESDTVLFSRLLGLWLSRDWTREIYRGAVARDLDTARVRSLWPDTARMTAGTIPHPLPAGPGPDTRLDPDAALAFLSELEESGVLPRFSGHTWAVSGEKTASGSPLVAVDFQADARVPVWWYLVRIKTPDTVLTGGTFPGFPFVLVGQNSALSFGLTPSPVDTMDVFLEFPLNADGSPASRPATATHYLARDEPRAFAVRDERIAVRFGTDHRFRVRSSRNGVIVSDSVPDSWEEPGRPLPPLALKATALARGDTTLQGYHRMNRARSVPDLQDASRFFVAPAFTLVFATRDNRIGRLPAGRFPPRSQEPPFSPRPGWQEPDPPPPEENEHPGATNPGCVDPPEGYVLAVDTVPDRSEHTPVCFESSLPGEERATRLEHLLETARALGMTEAMALQNDSVSPALARLLPVMLRFSVDSDTVDERSLSAARHLLSSSAWGYRMDPDRLEPLLAMTWIQELNAALFSGIPGRGRALGDPLDADLLERALTRDRFWCDDTPASPNASNHTASCDRLRQQTLSSALARLTREHPEADLFTQVRWGARHQARFRSPETLRMPLPERLLSVVLPGGGGFQTLDRRGGDARHDGASTPPGPGLRALMDPARPEESRFIVAPGQCGHSLSPHSRSQAIPWAEGMTVPLDDEDTSGGTLVLVPVDGGKTAAKPKEGKGR